MKTIKIKTEREREITLPYFCKYDVSYMAIFSEKENENIRVNIFLSGDCTIMTWCNINDAKYATQITEEEFTEKYNEVMEKLSSLHQNFLNPKMEMVTNDAQGEYYTD
jgi:hypothetical protein